MTEKDSGGGAQSITELQAENERLKRRLAEHERDTQTAPDPNILQSLADLKKATDDISEKLEAYAPIAEDVWGLRVFEKAKSYLINWITLGGITVVIAGLAVLGGIWKYAVDLIDAKIKDVSAEKLATMVQKEAERKVTLYFTSHSAEYTAHVETLTQQQISAVNAAVQRQQGYGILQSSLRSDSTATGTPATKLSSIDYSTDMGPVRDLGTEGSVVGFAIAYAMEYQVFKTAHEKVRLSPREIYNLARSREKSSATDSGATIADGIQVAQNDGVVLETAWPYRPGEFASQPPAAFAAAHRYKLRRADKITGIEQMKSALIRNGPIVAGITVYESTLGDETAKTGIVRMPKAKEGLFGGIAICIVGFDDARQQFKFIQAWSAKWGDKGYGYIPYAYIQNNSDDVWSIGL